MFNFLLTHYTKDWLLKNIINNDNDNNENDNNVNNNDMITTAMSRKKIEIKNLKKYNSFFLQLLKKTINEISKKY